MIRALPRAWAACFLLPALVLAGADVRAASPAVRVQTRILMDTQVTVSVAGADDERLTRGLERAFAALEAVDREMARIPGTPLWTLNERGGGKVSPALREVIAAALAWSDRSGGAFDATVAPLIDLWNFLSGPHPPPSRAAVAAALARTGRGKARLDADLLTLDGASLDLGGIAKGHAVDRAASALRGEGVENFLVDAGGDLFVSGTKNGAPWRVGIQDPRDPRAFLRVVTPAPGGLVTSGDYERGFEWEGVRYHHLLDPRTGAPARGCRSVTVWAPAAMDADAAATAVFVLGPTEGFRLLASLPGVEALVVDADGTLRETPGFSRVAPTAPPRSAP